MRFSNIISEFYPDQLRPALEAIREEEASSSYAAFLKARLLSSDGKHFVEDSGIKKWLDKNME